MNYIETESALYTIASEFITKQQPASGLFKGRNFMTPDLITLGKVRNSKIQGLYCEISMGSGFGGGYVTGLTFKDAEGNSYPDDSKCCHTLDEVREALKAMQKVTK